MTNTLKLQFFKWHLSASLGVVTLISLLCQWLWFPAPFLLLDGTWIALLILAGVDITLGPLLTLLLVSSKKSKRELVIDMSIILLVQISALIYGLVQIEQQRVVALVHFEHVFHAVTKKDIDQTGRAVILSNSTHSNKVKYCELATYKHMHYGMINHAETLIHYTNSNKPILYTSHLYLPLNKTEVNVKTFPLNKVPNSLKNKYNETYTFKGLAGKKRDAIVVLKDISETGKMKIIDIMIIPD